jgi:hypothetical protein
LADDLPSPLRGSAGSSGIGLHLLQLRFVFLTLIVASAWVIQARDHTLPPEAAARLALSAGGPAGCPPLAIGHGRPVPRRAPLGHLPSLDGSDCWDDLDDDDEVSEDSSEVVASQVTPLLLRRVVISRPEREASPPLFMTLQRFRC